MGKEKLNFDSPLDLKRSIYKTPPFGKKENTKERKRTVARMGHCLRVFGTPWRELDRHNMAMPFNSCNVWGLGLKETFLNGGVK